MRRRHNRHLGLAAWIWIFATIPCWADELSSQPLEVRLWSAMSRSISSTDAIGRQASVAYPSGSSENPAAIDVRDFELIDTRGYICMGTHHVVFSEDAWFAAGDINGFVHLNKAGTISVGYIRIATPEGSTRQGFDDDFRNNDFSMKYGRQIHKKGYVGFGVRVRDMELDYGDLFQGFPRDTQNHSIGGSFTLGGLWRPNPEWTLGALIDTGWIGSNVEGKVHFPGNTDVPFQLDITTQTMNVKAGFGWRALPTLSIYGDGQYFHIGNDMNTVDLGRFYFGGDVRLAEWISILAGGSVDTLAEATGSVGFNFHIFARNLLKLTYQYNPLPDISHEFGTGHIVSTTMVFGF